ncbi:unnamed protein product [Gongylonema pulchrum]|uniref:Uncharacterized protein n=1 Tax=Gongylonema pulchrum TaxID=637853 RepID=A0A183EQT1_9BILA|nr:unnamed protein product [Gongylonema pulchrum]
MITLSGSKRAGHCTSFPELYERLYPLVKRCPDLLIGNEQRNNIDRYSHTLRINCQMLATLCEFSKLERSALENTYDSVWNVLVRSRHKAVLDSCAICFGKMTAYCVTNDFSDLVYLYLEKINCQMLATLCEFSKLERSALENTYDSVWNVLVRSRHKAVLDSCAICFGKMTAYCVTNDFSDLVYLYLEKIFLLFMRKFSN